MQIVDVDFRWVKREEEYQNAFETPFTKVVQVLQWRKKIVTIEDRHGQETQWTDWQDVRTEEE